MATQSLSKMGMDMVNICFQDGRYKEAKKGLQLVRQTNNDPKFYKMIDGMIQICDEKLKCANCNMVGNFKKCSGCKKVHYCSAECQKTHWKTHKPECKC